MRSFFESFLNLIYPRLCVCCGTPLVKQEHFICSACEYELPLTRFHHQEDNPVARLFWGRVYFQYASAYLQFQKHSRVQKIIHHIKYHEGKALAIEMGRRAGMELISSPLQTVDMIVPVPLHSSKEHLRGFNQSLLIAEGMAQVMQKPVHNTCLVRTKASGTQTHHSRYARWENVEGIFAVRHPEQIAGKHLLLVDDVVTTGATAEACGTALLTVTGVKVSFMALAMAVN